MAAGIFLTLACLSVVLTLWQIWAARRFPLHQAVTPSGPLPPLTLLKPLKGCDLHTADCLESWCRQNYQSGVQLLFGVASAEDPVCRVVQNLKQTYPNLDLNLVICPERLGTNPKVSTLVQLQAHARYQHIVISDADVYAPPGFLERFVPPILDPHAGMVSAFYRLPDGPSLPMRLEAVSVNADFWSQVLQSQTLAPPAFALGAGMLTTSQRIASIGGLTALRDHLADDYELGRRIAHAGGAIRFSTQVVECRSAPLDWQGLWRHQVRWARTIRVAQPVPYFFSILANPTLWWVAALLSMAHPYVLLLAAGALAGRIVSAEALQSRLCQKPQYVNACLAPLKDLFQVAVWAAAFLGQKVYWRGEWFALRRDGTLAREREGAWGA